MYDNTDPNDDKVRIIEKGFYLGTPSSVDLSVGGYGGTCEGCAVFMYGNEMMRPARNGSWLCEDVLGKSCYEWVMKEAVYYATKQEIGNGSETRSIEDKCRRLEDGVRGSFLSSCGNLTGNERGWANVTAIRESSYYSLYLRSWSR